MVKDNISFYNVTDIGFFDLGVTQINKIIPFETENGVFINGSYVKFYVGDSLVKTKTIGDGLTIDGDNVLGTIKTLKLELNGSEFENLKGKTMDCRCSFFNEGDIEIEFKLKIMR